MPPYPSFAIPVKREIVKTMDNMSYCLVTYESDTSVMLFLGGEHTYCVKIQINKPYEFNLGNISNIYFNELCSLNKKLERGLDTQYLLRTMIAIIKQRYPQITKLTFTDASERECNEKYTIPLFHLYYILYGQTWYMKTFGATMSPKDKQKYDMADKKLQNLKTTLTWKEFYTTIITDTVLPLPYEDMEQLYNKTTTIQDFFIQIRDKIGASNFCIFVAPWLEEHLMCYKNYPLYIGMINFILPFDSVQLQQLPTVTIRDYSTSGGARKTRKRYRPRIYKGMWA